MNLSGNKIRSLSGIENHDLLETIDLEDNEVRLDRVDAAPHAKKGVGVW